MVRSILSDDRRPAGRGGIGLCRQHGVNCGDGKQAERKKSASHDGVPFSHASDGHEDRKPVCLLRVGMLPKVSAKRQFVSERF
jgi:hypothetical protein